VCEREAASPGNVSAVIRGSTEYLLKEECMSSLLLYTLSMQKREMVKRGYSRYYQNPLYAYIWYLNAHQNFSRIARKSMDDIRFPISAKWDTREAMRIGFGS
jgi:hypothetical protein